MNIVAIFFLLIIVVYTLGFAVTMWREKQKMGAMAVFFLIFAIIVLPFFSIFK